MKPTLDSRKPAPTHKPWPTIRSKEAMTDKPAQIQQKQMDKALEFARIASGVRAKSK
jgi:hypothetical protein